MACGGYALLIGSLARCASKHTAVQKAEAEGRTVDARRLPCESRVASRRAFIHANPSRTRRLSSASLLESGLGSRISSSLDGVSTSSTTRSRFATCSQRSSSTSLRAGVRVLSRLLGEGLLTSEARLHVRQRRLVQPAFARAAAYGEVMLNETLAMLARWRDGATRDVAAEMTRVTLACYCGKTLFGSDMLDAVETEREALTSIMELFPTAMGPLDPLYDHLPMPPTVRFLAEARHLRPHRRAHHRGAARRGRYGRSAFDAAALWGR
jgi:cytochrome P450